MSGVVGYLSHQVFHVVAMAEEKHATRAMLDGQIHDIYKVGDTIRRVKNSLERQIGFALTDVCIAAAGRVLKTVNASAEYAFENETRVTQEHIIHLIFLRLKRHMHRLMKTVRIYIITVLEIHPLTTNLTVLI